MFTHLVYYTNFSKSCLRHYTSRCHRGPAWLRSETQVPEVKALHVCKYFPGWYIAGVTYSQNVLLEHRIKPLVKREYLCSSLAGGNLIYQGKDTDSIYHSLALTTEDWWLVLYTYMLASPLTLTLTSMGHGDDTRRPLDATYLVSAQEVM